MGLGLAAAYLVLSTFRFHVPVELSPANIIPALTATPTITFTKVLLIS
jgi:hypothetical protein